MVEKMESTFAALLQIVLGRKLGGLEVLFLRSSLVEKMESTSATLLLDAVLDDACSE